LFSPALFLFLLFPPYFFIFISLLLFYALFVSETIALKSRVDWDGGCSLLVPSSPIILPWDKKEKKKKENQTNNAEDHDTKNFMTESLTNTVALLLSWHI